MTGTNELHPLAPTPIATPPIATPPVDVHPGLGPVILPAAPVASPAPSGARGLLRRAVERVTRFETDRQRASDAPAPLKYSPASASTIAHWSALVSWASSTRI